MASQTPTIRSKCCVESRCWCFYDHVWDAIRQGQSVRLNSVAASQVEVVLAVKQPVWEKNQFNPHSLLCLAVFKLQLKITAAYSLYHAIPNGLRLKNQLPASLWDLFESPTPLIYEIPTLESQEESDDLLYRLPVRLHHEYKGRPVEFAYPQLMQFKPLYGEIVHSIIFHEGKEPFYVRTYKVADRNYSHFEDVD